MVEITRMNETKNITNIIYKENIMAKKNCKNKNAFSADSTIGEVIKDNPKAQGVLMGFGMHCFGCPMSQMETLGEAAAVHGVDIDLMLEKLSEIKPGAKDKCGCGCGKVECDC